MNPSVTSNLDPITLEVIRNKLDGIANEMETTLFKSAFSPIVKEGLDASAALFDADGTMLAQACAVPIHLATLMPALAEVLKTFPPDTMQAGDIYMLNDPYCGGTHLPDVAIIMPIVVDGRVLAFSACMTHHQDLGGMRAGSVPTDATEIFQEGLRIPPVRWCRGGEFDPTLTAILRLNVRIPDTFMGDLHAQVAACKVGVLRLGALARKYGDNFLTVAFGELLDRSEMMTREALRRIPAGTYRAVDYLDNDGIDLERRIRIEVAATIGDGDGGILFDLSGSSEQVRGPLNCVPSGSLAAACFAVRALTDPTIPTNGGCFRPIRLNLPAGSIVNPSAPAPVNSRTATIKRITSCMLATLAEVLPDKVPAESGGELLVLAFGGRRESTGETFVTGELIAGGSGAGQGFDGVDVIETDATNCMNLPAEAMELDAPVRVHRVALRRDSGGTGEFRGGLGIIKEFEALQDGISFSHRGERHFVAAAGRNGGGDGALAYSVIRRADGREEVIPSKMVTQLNKGDRVMVTTAGGGGYGWASERDVGASEEDLMNDKVSLQAGCDDQCRND